MGLRRVLLMVVVAVVVVAVDGQGCRNARGRMREGGRKIIELRTPYNEASGTPSPHVPPPCTRKWDVDEQGIGDGVSRGGEGRRDGRVRDKKV